MSVRNTGAVVASGQRNESRGMPVQESLERSWRRPVAGPPTASVMIAAGRVGPGGVVLVVRAYPRSSDAVRSANGLP